MKQRVLVMNGQRIVQSEQEGTWTNEKVDKAGALKPGIYNIYSARKADKSQRYHGLIVHADKNGVVQQTGKSLVRHARSDFDTIPDIGQTQEISYSDQGKAIMAQAAKMSKGRRR